MSLLQVGLTSFRQLPHVTLLDKLIDKEVSHNSFFLAFLHCFFVGFRKLAKPTTATVWSAHRTICRNHAVTVTVHIRIHIYSYSYKM